MSDSVEHDPRKETETRPEPLASGPETGSVDFDTRELFAGRSEIRIAHDNAVYRMRITRAGKLILNK